MIFLVNVVTLKYAISHICSGVRKMWAVKRGDLSVRTSARFVFDVAALMCDNNGSLYIGIYA